MKSLATYLVCTLAIGSFFVSNGCGPRGGGVVQESDEMTFDQMAEMAAKETDLSEQDGGNQ